MSLPESNDVPMRDEIVAEVRAIRETLAAEFGHDLDRLFDEIKRREALSDRPIIPSAPRRLSSATVT